MRDEDDADALRLQVRNLLEQVVYLVGCERSGGLVQRDKSRLADQRPRQLHQLLLRDRQPFRRRARIDLQAQ